MLLTPATVCLAIPLYAHFQVLKKHFKAILIGIASGVLVTPQEAATESDTRPAQNRPKPTPGSNAFVPAVAGLILAGEVIKDIASK